MLIPIGCTGIKTGGASAKYYRRFLSAQFQKLMVLTDQEAYLTRFNLFISYFSSLSFPSLTRICLLISQDIEAVDIE